MMKDAKLIQAWSFSWGETELRYNPKRNGSTWPGYHESAPLGKKGYWYGNHRSHEWIPASTAREALDHLERRYGI